MIAAAGGAAFQWIPSCDAYLLLLLLLFLSVTTNDYTAVVTITRSCSYSNILYRNIVIETK